MGKNKQSNKQPKDDTPNPNNVVNREIFQRLNFLYQASAYLKGIEAPVSTPLEGSHVEHPSRGNFLKKGRKRRQVTLGELGSNYVQCMRTIGNKSVIRMFVLCFSTLLLLKPIAGRDPSVKRTLCKGCNTVVLPGMTATVRVRGTCNICRQALCNHCTGSAHMGREVVYTCLTCHTPRIIPAPPVAPSTTLASSSTCTTLQTTFEDLEAPTPPLGEIPVTRPQMRKRYASHRLPLFARSDVGHIIFRGNEILREEQ